VISAVFCRTISRSVTRFGSSERALVAALVRRRGLKTALQSLEGSSLARIRTSRTDG